jgi:hypothetical protein
MGTAAVSPRRGMALAAGNGGLREECEPAGQNSAAREGGSRLVARWWGEEEDKLARPGKSGDLYVSCFFFSFFARRIRELLHALFLDVILIHE